MTTDRWLSTVSTAASFDALATCPSPLCGTVQGCWYDVPKVCPVCHRPFTIRVDGRIDTGEKEKT